MLSFKQFIKKSETLEEKNLAQEELDDLIKRTLQAVRGLLQDTKKDPRHLEKAKEVLTWVKSVRSTYQQQGSLHPNTVTGLYRIMAGISSGRFGYATPGYSKSGDGRVPQDFRK